MKKVLKTVSPIEYRKGDVVEGPYVSLSGGSIIHGGVTCDKSGCHLDDVSASTKSQLGAEAGYTINLSQYGRDLNDSLEILYKSIYFNQTGSSFDCDIEYYRPDSLMTDEDYQWCQMYGGY